MRKQKSYKLWQVVGVCASSSRFAYGENFMVKRKGVGIPGLEPPETICEDPLCPWHGKLPVRGQVLRLRIEKFRMQNVAVAIHEYLHYNQKYKRYEVRRKKKHVRVPPCIPVKPGDEVIVAETRPLAKSVSFVVVGKA